MPKKYNSLVVPTALALLFFGAAPLEAAPQASSTVKGVTPWKGVTISAYQITRLPGNRVAVKFAVMAGPDTPRATVISGPTLKVEIEKVNPDGRRATMDVLQPYSLAKSRLLDDQGNAYEPAALLPGENPPGLSETVQTIGPNEGLVLGMVYACPPPADGKKVPLVSFELPQVQPALSRVPLPQEENVPLNP